MRPRLVLVLVLGLLIAALGAACGSGSSGGGFTPPGPDGSLSDGTSSGGGDGSSLFGDGSFGDVASGPLAISPQNKVLTVPYGQHTPTVQYTATAGGAPVPASFAIDLGQVGTIDASTGLLKPGGLLGGVANVTASYGGQKVSTTVTVVISLTDNGAPAGYDAGSGTGGNGGVGGSPPGAGVSTGTQGTLQGTPQSDPGLAWLYPYDQTVWPQGVLPPLLQWTAPRNYDAIYIHMQDKSVDYKGFFSAPVAGQPFVNVPLLATAWDTILFSNQGDPVTITLTFAAGGVAYGPLKETWKVAQGSLTGTVYYNSYGTALAQNYCCTSTGAMFGGATLAIKHGATSPVLIAGSSGGNAQCRVCHSVAAQGKTLVTQHGDDYNASSAYALTNGNKETAIPGSGTFAFPAIFPDGTFLFSNAGPLPGISPPGTSGLFSIPSGATIAATGLPANLAAGTPVFSPDGKHVAYNDLGAGGSLASLDFNLTGNVFSNQQTLDTPSAGRDLFPAFLPTNDAVIFEREVANDGEYGATRNGSRGELWWVDLKTHTAAALTNLNGGTYLPTSGTNHTMDQTLQYEPTVNPVASGGYAWVVFTSRRLYGNVATQDPFLSDPRNYDPSQSATTKKLWVAAIDLSAKPGTDPSHPAFYLPGQELLAGNSRGYWVVDPCEPNGSSCLTGDQCCSGFCEDVDGGFVCGMQPPGCSATGNKCKTSADCCGSSTGIQCIDGYCTQPSPQ